jgi:hypothetical protein
MTAAAAAKHVDNMRVIAQTLGLAAAAAADATAADLVAATAKAGPVASSEEADGAAERRAHVNEQTALATEFAANATLVGRCRLTLSNPR